MSALSRVMLAYTGIVSVPAEEALSVTKIIYRETEDSAPEEGTLGRFGEADGVRDESGEPETAPPTPTQLAVKLAPQDGDKVKGNSYRRTPDQKPPRRKSNPKSYTHEKNREYQQKFKDLNGDRK